MVSLRLHLSFPSLPWLTNDLFPFRWDVAVARGWDVDLATQMLMEYLRWREVNPVGCIKNESITTSLAAKKVFMLKEKDWHGRPVLVVSSLTRLLSTAAHGVPKVQSQCKVTLL